MYNKDKYSSLEEYLAAVDASIDAEREKNGVHMEDNTPTPEELQDYDKPDGWESEEA